MAYEIVKFEDDAGASVTITPEDVRQTFCPTATNQEVQLFLALCATKRLNPFTKEAYLVKYGSNPAQMITARSAFEKRADAAPDYEGTEIGVVVLCADGSIQHMPGEAYYPLAGQQLIGGWARVHRTGRKPYYAEVARQEYDTGKSNWARMPGTMIAKVAETHALRMAFPSTFDGMYAPEEMGNANAGQPPAQPVAATVEPPQQPQQQPQKPSDEDLAYLKQSLASLVAAGYVHDEVRGYLWQTYKDGGRKAVEAAYAEMMAQPQATEAADPEPVEADLYDADLEF